jgi:predicted dehydrogenase
LLDYGLSIIDCHAIDQARFLIGEIEAVSAVTASRWVDVSPLDPVNTT